MSTPTLLPALAHEAYNAVVGLSQSGMKDLEVSPLRYWHLRINPDRPADDPTPEMRFGAALHCAVLEPEEVFDERYARAISEDDCPGALVTIDDIRSWLTAHEIKPKGTRKDDLIGQALAYDPNVPIYQVLARRHHAETQGKTLLSSDQWTRLTGAVQSLRAEPRLNKLLAGKGGQSEVAYYAKDPTTGVMLKARMDYTDSARIIDLKTFVQKRGKSIDKSIADAIYYEHYYRQAYFYDMVRRLATGAKHEQFEFVMVFVESEPPHEVRMKSLCPKLGGTPNLYWERARFECRELIYRYAECQSKFGDRPWRFEQDIEILSDEDIPQLAW